MPAILSLLLQVGAAPPVTVSARPSPIHVERSAAAQKIEFDFLIAGRTNDTVRLTAIRLVATDAKNHPWYIRSIDGNGSDPSIATVPRRQVAGRDTLLIYNPFSVFPPDVPLDRLRYELTFAGPGGESVVPVTIEPVRWRQPIPLTIPVKGRLLVFEGHDFYSHHRRFDYTHPILQKAGLRTNSGRYAHDLSIVDERGSMFRNDGKRNEDWYSWGAPVRAPGAGTVVAVEGGMPDYDVGRPEAGLAVDSILARPVALMGNHVIIAHAGGLFSRLFHLKQGSVRVKVGERVAAGQVVGAIGFSGSVYTVHLHYEAGTGPGLDSEGLPAYFSRFRRVHGARAGPLVTDPIDTGDIVLNP